MKLQLMILSLAACLTLSPLCQAAKRYHKEAAFSRPTTSRNIISMLCAQQINGRRPTPFESLKKLLAHRCKQLGNAIAASDDQEFKDNLKYQIDCLISFIQTPTRNALHKATTALTGKTLDQARAAFAELRNGDELTKMAWRYAWWQQHYNSRHENLDPHIDLIVAIEDFTESTGWAINFSILQDLPNANQLTQLLIDLVLCNNEQKTLTIEKLPTNCSLTVTSAILNQFYASNNQGLISLDLSTSPAIARLFVEMNHRLTSLNLTNCHSLSNLFARYNQQLTSLDLRNNPALSELFVYGNESLTNFSIPAGTRLLTEKITQVDTMVTANRARLDLLLLADAAEHGSCRC